MTVAAVVATAMAATAAAPAFAADEPVSPWSQVTSLQGDFDLRAGDIEVLKTSVASPAHRLTYPFTDIDLIQGGGAEAVVDTPLLRLTADGTSWTVLPFTGTSTASIRADGILVSVMGNLVYDGSATSQAVCPVREGADSRAEARGIVAGLTVDVYAGRPVWEFDKKTPYLDLGDAGRSVSTPDAVMHIRVESVTEPGDDAASAWVLLTVDLRGSLPDYGPVDQRIATVKLATSEVSCVQAASPGSGAPGVGAPGASPEPATSEPVVIPPSAPPTQPAVVAPTVAPRAALAESGSELPWRWAFAGALLAAAGFGMLRLTRRA